jgi:hypothetical protein
MATPREQRLAVEIGQAFREAYKEGGDLTDPAVQARIKARCAAKRDLIFGETGETPQERATRIAAEKGR